LHVCISGQIRAMHAYVVELYFGLAIGHKFNAVLGRVMIRTSPRCDRTPNARLICDQIKHMILSPPLLGFELKQTNLGTKWAPKLNL